MRPRPDSPAGLINKAVKQNVAVQRFRISKEDGEQIKKISAEHGHDAGLIELLKLLRLKPPKPVFEKTYTPVLVTEMSFGDSNQPLKPGYSRQFGVKMDDAPSEWTKKVDVKVTQVEFQ